MEHNPENSSLDFPLEDKPEKKKKDSRKESVFPLPIARVEQEGDAKKQEAVSKSNPHGDILAALAIKPNEVPKAASEKSKSDKAAAENTSIPSVSPEQPRPGQREEDKPRIDNLESEDDDEEEESGETPKKPERKTVPAGTEAVSESHESVAEALLAESPIDENEETSELTEAEEEYEPLPVYELKPNELNGGEVVIPLDGDREPAERVILLHAAEPAGAAAERSPEQTPVEIPPPVWRSQPEQQHQARFETPEQVPERPEDVPYVETQPESPNFETPAAERPQQPDAPGYTSTSQFEREVSEARYTTTGTYMPIVPGTEKVASQKEVEDAVYYATKSGQRRGLVTGLFVGGLYEHFKHKRREKKAEKRFKQQGKQLEQAHQDLKFSTQEQARQSAEAVARQDELQAQRRAETRARFGVGETRSRSQQTGESVLQAVGVEKQRSKAEKPVGRTPEQLAAEEQPQLAVAEGNRLETSAWHSIEVDAKTGRAVENPTFEYGQEFHRERAKETVPAEGSATSASGGSDDATTLLAAASKIPNASTSGGVMPPSNLPNATTQGAPSNPKDKAKAALLSLTKPKSDDNPSQPGPIWPWLLALGVIVVLLIALL